LLIHQAFTRRIYELALARSQTDDGGIGKYVYCPARRKIFDIGKVLP
jgi:hypothetical protein